MKRFALLLMMIIALSSVSFAQKKNNEGKNVEYKEYRMKVLAQEMDLKEDQRKKFFELYEQMWAEKIKLFKDTKALEKKLKDSSEVTDEEYKKASDAITNAKEKIAEIEKRYDEKFSQFLSQKQIYKMKSVEDKLNQRSREIHNQRKAKK